MAGSVKSVTNFAKSPSRVLTAVGTAGASEAWRKTNPAVAKLQQAGDKWLGGNGSGNNGLSNMSPENPATLLAQTGGAPLLANIALGANVDDALAGYFGKSDFRSFYEGLSDSDRELVDGVKQQLTSIQSNTEMRNKAVQQVVNDFPNVVAHAAQARQAAGQEFDDTTKAYLDKALGASAAKYAAGGNLSSGAMLEASGRIGADMGMQKLGYQDSREASDYNMGAQGWQARYNETNALRNFQNIMTQGAAGNGFSAAQASLNRTQQTGMMNAGFANQQNLQNQQSDNQMLGAIGGLAGTALGGYLGGPMGAGMGNQMGRSMASGASTGGTNYNAFPQGSPTMNEPLQAPRLNLRY